MGEYEVYSFHDALPCHNFSYIEKPLLNLLDMNRNTCILDIGCGNGYLVNTLLMGFTYGSIMAWRHIKSWSRKH